MKKHINPLLGAIGDTMTLVGWVGNRLEEEVGKDEYE